MRHGKGIYKQRKDGGSIELFFGFEKPYFRNLKKDKHRQIYFYFLPTLHYMSTDNYRGGGEYVEQTTIGFNWLLFYIYFEIFKKVKK